MLPGAKPVLVVTAGGVSLLGVVNLQRRFDLQGRRSGFVTGFARSCDFDWADLERRLGEAEEQLEDRDFAALGSALQSIIEWIIKGAGFAKLDADAHVGRRAIALFWTLNPDYFEGVSLTTLANRLGLHKAILSAQAAEARRRFGIKNRGQAHGWNFGKAEPKPPQTRKGGALAEAAMSQLKGRLFRSSQTKQTNGG